MKMRKIGEIREMGKMEKVVDHEINCVIIHCVIHHVVYRVVQRVIHRSVYHVVHRVVHRVVDHVFVNSTSIGVQ